jgi:RecQ family ATP-dependent DNA helicase
MEAMTGKLEQFVNAACEIADGMRHESQFVSLALLERFFPKGFWRDDEEELHNLALLLDAAGVALKRRDGKQAELRRRTRDTGPLDQAIRIRDGFREKRFGPKEYLSKATLARLGSMSKAGTTDHAGALGEALEAVGFKSLGSWATTWNRHRLFIPDEGVELRLEGPKLQLAKPRQVNVCSPVAGDDLLQRHFPDFRSYTCAAQRDAVHAILEADGPEVVIVRLPTGSGKSLLYLLASAEWRRRGKPATSVVVSPVIAIQNDQVRKIKKDYHFARLEAAELNSTVSSNERNAIYRRLRAGKLDALFVGPEKLVDPFFQQILIESAMHIRLFVVDEAHMVAEWGQDFRPDFFRLGVVRNRLRDQNPQIQTLLLSATLTENSERVLLQVFRVSKLLSEANKLVSEAPKANSFNERSIRTELSIRVIRHSAQADSDETLIGLVRQVPRPCIIYCARKEHVRKLRSKFRQLGIRRFLDYMGSTPPDSRRERLEAFHSGDVDFVLATNAFGLGVDKADVRSVIHYDVPSNLDEYYQQIGRAARDHLTGHAFLLYSPASMRRATRDKRAIIKTETAAARAQTMLDERLELPADGAGGCLLPLHALPKHIEQASSLNRSWNFAVLNILEQVGDLDIDRAVLREVWVREGSKPQRLDRYPDLKRALRLALPKKAGQKVDLAAFSISENVSFSQLEQDLVKAVLEFAVELVRDDEVSSHDREEWVLVHRHGARTWTRQHTLRLEDHRNQRFQLAEKQRKQLRNFLSAQVCRMRAFEEVYGYTLGQACGHCDKCDKSLMIEASDEQDERLNGRRGR